MSIFSKNQLDQFHSEMVQSYHDFLEDLREEGPEDETDGLSEDFLNHFKFIAESKALNDFSPLKFYWVNLVDNLIYVLQMWQDADEEGLTDFWTESEYSEAFIDLSNQGDDPISITSNLMPLLEGQVLGFYHWHLSSLHKAKENPTLYQQISDLGDHDLGIRIGEDNYVAPPQAHNDAPSLPFWNKSFKDKTLSIDDDGGELIGGMQELESIIIGDKKITLKGSTPELDESILEYKAKIQHALEMIQKHSPDCFSAFSIFTNSLILVDEPGIVSYSLQSLPGYSNINVKERDDIDLMDDLVHENGHHLLNSILNANELLEEDDDKIFWSPWRNSLRPIRGMYHGYLTFIWAYLLFKDLRQAKADLTDVQFEKVCARSIEEYYMLDFCHAQLEYAFKQGKVTSQGHEIFCLARDFLTKEKDSINEALELLSPKSLAQISELKESLSLARKKYLNFL